MFQSAQATASIARPYLSWRRSACTLGVLATLCANFLGVDRHDGQRCLEVILLCVCALVIALQGGSGPAPAATLPSRLALSAFFMLGLVSALCAWSLRHALFEWSSLLLLVLVAQAVSAEVAGAGVASMRRILQCVGLACFVYSLRMSLVYAAALANGFQIGIHELAVGFSNVRFLNHTQTAFMPVLALLYLQAPARSAQRHAWFALLAFWWALLYVSEARASVLGLAAGCALALLLRGRQAYGFVKAMAWAALAGGLVYGAFFVLLPQLAGLQPIGSVMNLMQRTASDPASGRQFLWIRALQLIAAHPWLGVGPLHFAHDGADVHFGAHPHDFMLQFAVEWGIPALLCLLAAGGMALRAWLRTGAGIAAVDSRQQQVFAMFCVAIAAIAVDALFSGVLVMPQSRLAIMLVVACASGWARSLAPLPASRALAPARRWTTAALAMLAAGLLVWSVAPDFAAHASHAPLRAAEQAANPIVHWPRMWEAGYF